MPSTIARNYDLGRGQKVRAGHDERSGTPFTADSFQSEGRDSVYGSIPREDNEALAILERVPPRRQPHKDRSMVRMGNLDTQIAGYDDGMAAVDAKIDGATHKTAAGYVAMLDQNFGIRAAKNHGGYARLADRPGIKAKSQHRRGSDAEIRERLRKIKVVLRGEEGYDTSPGAPTIQIKRLNANPTQDDINQERTRRRAAYEQHKDRDERRAKGELKSVFISNLSYDAHIPVLLKELKSMCEQFGVVERITIPKAKQGNQPHRGIAFVEMAAADAQVLLQNMRGERLLGRTLRLEMAKPPAPRK